jgi:hypothetical protein
LLHGHGGRFADDESRMQSGSVVVGYAVLPAKQHLRINGDSETARLLYMLISLSCLPIEAQVKPPVKCSEHQHPPGR